MYRQLLPPPVCRDMALVQYSSTSLTKLSEITKEFDSVKKLQDDLLSYHRKILAEKIKNVTIDRKTMIYVYDFLYIADSHMVNADAIVNLVIGNKILETRALALDLICNDYYDDGFDSNEKIGYYGMADNYGLQRSNEYKDVRTVSANILRMPDIWMMNIIQDIKKTFNLPLLHRMSQHILQLFVNAFLEDSKKVFVGNRKFKAMGNQLILNYVYFCTFLEKHITINWTTIDALHMNIEENVRIGIDTIKTFLHNKCDIDVQ